MGFQRYKISFLDLYKHVQTTLIKYCQKVADEKTKWWVGIILGSYGAWQLHFNLNERLYIYSLLKTWVGKDIQLEVCGEPDWPKELGAVGCVSKKDLDYFIIPIELETTPNRVGCLCLGNKKELLHSNKKCNHSCLYCYLP
jgi:hypothetical protein